MKQMKALSHCVASVICILLKPEATSVSVYAQSELNVMVALPYIGVLSSAWCPGGRTTAKPFWKDAHTFIK